MIKKKSQNKIKKTTGIKPIVKDGFHYRWYFHLSSGWQIVEVSPWDNYQCCFNRCGFAEEPNHWVKNTYPWQWGPIIPNIDSDFTKQIPNWVFKDNDKVIQKIAEIRGSNI